MKNILKFIVISLVFSGCVSKSADHLKDLRKPNQVTGDFTSKSIEPDLNSKESLLGQSIVSYVSSPVPKGYSLQSELSPRKRKKNWDSEKMIKDLTYSDALIKKKKELFNFGTIQEFIEDKAVINGKPVSLNTVCIQISNNGNIRNGDSVLESRSGKLLTVFLQCKGIVFTPDYNFYNINEITEIEKERNGFKALDIVSFKNEAGLVKTEQLIGFYKDKAILGACDPKSLKCYKSNFIEASQLIKESQKSNSKFKLSESVSTTNASINGTVLGTLASGKVIVFTNGGNEIRLYEESEIMKLADVDPNIGYAINELGAGSGRVFTVFTDERTRLDGYTVWSFTDVVGRVYKPSVSSYSTNVGRITFEIVNGQLYFRFTDRVYTNDSWSKPAGPMRIVSSGKYTGPGMSIYSHPAGWRILIGGSYLNMQ